MSYKATVVNIMIASPNDVKQYREKVRDIIYEWNDLQSETTSIVLQPVGWESHAWPEMGAPPQKIINRQVLERCDLLVAIFWSRLGTPTDEFSSGSVEEIETHMAKGKPTMIYFCEANVDGDSPDNIRQFKAVLEFKEKCASKGLLDGFSTLDEFSSKFTKHLGRIVADKFSSEFVGEIVMRGQTNPAGVVTKICFEGNRLVATAEIEQAIISEVGEKMTIARARADSKAIQELYRKHGYAALVSDIKVNSEGILIYSLQEGMISKIEIKGLVKIDQSFVQDMIYSRPKEPFSQERLSKDLNRIYDSGYFTDVIYKISDDTFKAGFLIITITLTEK